MTAPLKSVLVAMPTLGTRAVGSSLREIESQAGALPHDVSVVLLHNSPDRDDELARLADGHVASYVQVPRRGFSSVRNAALDLALGHDVLVFIDDDEIPVAGWLQAHLDALVGTGADITTGPVAAVLPPGGPRWLDEGRLLRPNVDRPTGPTNDLIGSGNTALRMSFVRTNDLRFDLRYETVGEDTDFFCRCLHAGASIFWVKEAGVIEFQDADRLKIRYVLRRAFINASFYTAYSSNFPDHIRRSRLTGKIARIVLGFVQTGHGLLRADSRRVVRGLSDLAAAAGGLVGLTRSVLVSRPGPRLSPPSPR